MVDIPFHDLFIKGKVLKNAIVLSAAKYVLLKTPNMKKIDGNINLTLTLLFAEEDCMPHLEKKDLKLKSIRDMINKLKAASQANIKSILDLPNDDNDVDDVDDVDGVDEVDDLIEDDDEDRLDLITDEITPPEVHHTPSSDEPQVITDNADNEETLIIQTNIEPESELLKPLTSNKETSKNDTLKLKKTASLPVESLLSSAKDSDVNSAGGNAAAAIRALREVTSQRELLQQQLQELTK